MKGPGIKDYMNALTKCKEEAHQQGKTCIEINSKQLHQKISPKHATMPTCCQAMYKQMLSGDEIIERPKGTTGFGSHLTIRFYVDTLEGREPLHPQKKRGRPAKSEEEKAAARKAKLKHTTQDLCSLLKSWLGEHGWEYVEEKGIIDAHSADKRWIINVQGIKRGRKQPLPIKLSEILTQMEDASADYSMAFNDSISYRRQWQEIPQSVKERLHMSVILADKKGNIVKI